MAAALGARILSALLPRKRPTPREGTRVREAGSRSQRFSSASLSHSSQTRATAAPQRTGFQSSKVVPSERRGEDMTSSRKEPPKLYAV